MPLYEYECGACGRRFEIIQKISDPAAETCPTCGGPVHKLQSAPAFQFKGTGWYVTDYARKDQAAARGDGGAKDEAKAGADKGGKGADSGKGATSTGSAPSPGSSSSAGSTSNKSS